MLLYEASENARLCALITDQMRTLQPYMAYILELPGRTPSWIPTQTTACYSPPWPATTPGRVSW
jgi:hypothetical protein